MNHDAFFDAFKTSLTESIQALSTQYPAAASQVFMHLSPTKGKMLRAMLSAHTASALGGMTPKHIELSLAIECLHSATLLHDDVIDEAPMRRGKASAPRIFGNGQSVLAGDYLFADSVRLVAQLGVVSISNHYASLLPEVIQGELEQLAILPKDEDLDDDFSPPSLEALESVASKKTGALFSFACRASALLCGTDEKTADALGKFGAYLGLAFQLADDILDYQASPSQSGKRQGQDMHEGQWTLPSAWAFNQMNAHDRHAFLQIWRADDFEAVLGKIHEFGGMKHAILVFEGYILSAHASLDGLGLDDAGLRAILGKVQSALGSWNG